MNKDLGRLALKDIKDTEAKVEKIFKLLDSDKIDLAKTNMIKLLSTPNYFIRELVGKKLVEYHDEEKMDQLILTLLGHKIYGVRAGTIFYYFLKHNDDAMRIVNLLEMSWHDTPWETEHILYEMWNKYPQVMKKEMIRWATASFERQRTLAYHGMETIATDDPLYIIRTIELNLDDICGELQKKISSLLTSVLRVRPAECYPFVREWMKSPTEARNKVIFTAMKKLIVIALNKNENTGKSHKNDEFYLLTKQVISDWKADPDKNISSMGAKLVTFSKNPVEDLEV